MNTFLFILLFSLCAWGSKDEDKVSSPSRTGESGEVENATAEDEEEESLKDLEEEENPDEEKTETRDEKREESPAGNTDSQDESAADKAEAHDTKAHETRGDCEKTSAQTTDDKGEREETPQEEPPIQETVVKAVRQPPPKDRTAAVTKLHGEDIRRSTRTSTVEALSQESAGVYVTGRGMGFHGVASGASGGIYIRGLGGSPNSQVLVVENGIPDAQGIFGHPIPDAYVPFLIDDVQVIMGGDSVLYGSNAVGGVIIINERRLTTEGWEFNNDTSFGSYNTLRQTNAFLARWKNLELATAFHGHKSDGHRDGAGGSNKVGTFTLNWHIRPGYTLTLRNKLIKLTGADPGPVTHPNYDHWYDVLRDNASLKFSVQKAKHQLDFVTYANVGVHRLYDGFYSLDFTTGGFGEWNFRIVRNLGVLVGIGAERIDGQVENRIQDEEHEVRGFTNLSLYQQIDYRPFSSLHLTAGSRQMYNTRYGGVIMAKGGATWEAWRGLKLRSRVTRNFRQPTLRELYLPFPTANPDLKPEVSLNWDFGIAWEYKNFEISTTVYYSSVRNLIKYFGAWPSAEVVNIDRVIVWGVEGVARLRDIGPFCFRITGNWQDVGRYTKQNPDAKINFAVNAKHSYKKHHFFGSISGEWVRGLYMNNYKRDPIKDVFFIDASFNYRYTYSHDRMLEPYIMLRNLLNNRYAYIEGYTMPGFNITAGIRLKL